LFLNLECICKISCSLSTNETNIGFGAKAIAAIKTKVFYIVGCTSIKAKTNQVSGQMLRRIDIIVIVMFGLQQSW
jgi:hypothetical protein